MHPFTVLLKGHQKRRILAGGNPICLGGDVVEN